MTEAKSRVKEFAIVKGTIPKSLKIQFKVFCVKKNVEMSEVIEALIKQWLQKGATVSQLNNNLLQEELEEIKGYVSKNVKCQFKLICKQKQVTMRSVLHTLITMFIEMDSSRE